MDDFVEYVKNLRNNFEVLPKYEDIHIVIGNESCDLDSTVSALSYAYFLHEITYNSSANILVVPLMNVTSEEFLLRTENRYCLSKIGIDLNWLLYGNDIDCMFKNDGKLKVTLVDHHVLSNKNEKLRDYVIEIYDHRPLDESANWRADNVLFKIEQVGSCTTLISDIILNHKEILTKSLADILYKTINFDTIGFKSEAGKVTDLDLLIGNALELFLNIDKKNRIAIFEELWEVHNDVSHLNAKQLLYKDLKKINSIFIPGLPMLVRQYLQMPDVLTSIKDFVIENNVSVLVLMGLEAKQTLQRDLALYSLSDCHTMNIIMEKLLRLEMLSLKEKELNVQGIKYFVQENSKPSRKQILPIIKEICC